MRNFTLLQFAALGALLLNTACSFTASSNVKSKAIHASNTVAVSNNSAVCSAILQVGGTNGTYIDLDGGDQLNCNGIKMSRHKNIANQIWYEATLPYVPGGTYNIQLVRGDETMNSSIKIPSQIEDARIEGGPSHKIGEPLTVVWKTSQASGESVNVELTLSSSRASASRTVLASDSAGDSGTATFSGTDTVITTYENEVRKQEPGPYNGTVWLRRKATGFLSGSWSGEAIGTQKISLRVTLQ